LNWAVEVSKQYDKRYPVEPFTLLQYDQPQPCNHCEGTGVIIVKRPFEALEQAGDVSCPMCSGTGKTDMMVELPFALPLYTHYLDEVEVSVFLAKYGQSFEGNAIPVFYSGRIDLPLVLDSSIWVMDHKTTSILGDMFWTKMKMSAQQKGYCWAFKELTGKDVQGYIVNAIRTKEPPQWVVNGGTSKTGSKQSPEQWWNESLQRERYYLKQGELDEWKNNAIELCEEFFWHYSRGIMPMKTSWCSQFGKCQYYDVCSLEQLSRGAMLASGLFKDNDWTPLRQVKQETKQTK
jgi:hypothetical protein